MQSKLRSWLLLSQAMNTEQIRAILIEKTERTNWANIMRLKIKCRKISNRLGTRKKRMLSCWKEKVRIMRNHSPNQSNNGKLLKKLKNQSVQDKDTEKKKKACWIQAFSLVHHQGLEPWTPWLRVRCSTNWANGALLICSHFQVHCLLYSFYWVRQPLF